MTDDIKVSDETDGEFLARVGTDASAWGAEFAQRFGVNVDDARSWFANAIGAGETAGHNQFMNDAHFQAARLGVDLTEVYTPNHLVEIVHGHGHPTFANAQELDDYLQELCDRGETHDGVPILDANKVVWLTYGEEYSTGGEANVCHLLQGDPREDFMEEKDADEADTAGEWAYVPVPLSQAAYPVVLLYAPPAE